VKVVVITPGYPPVLGGLETHVSGVVEQLPRLGVDVEVWTPNRNVTVATTTVEAEVVVHRFPSTSSSRFPFSPGLFRHAHRQLALADVVHVHGYHATPALAGLFAPARTPLVVTPHFHGGGHTLLADLLHRPYRVAGQRLFTRAARVIAVSAAEDALLGQSFPVTGEKTVVIHNAADTAGINAACPWPDRAPTVLVLGRMEAYKRIDLAIAAFDSCSEPGQLVVLGDGPDRDRLSALARSARRADDIRLLGRVDDVEVKRWLRTARAVVSMSEHEAFGLIAIEAVAAGSNAILSELPAHREVQQLLPAGTATIVNSDSAPAALDDALRRTGENQVRTVRSWPEAAAEHVTLYESLLEARSG
jgi:glycosyltransferase involved in cell wall biosynthesis